MGPVDVVVDVVVVVLFKTFTQTFIIKQGTWKGSVRRDPTPKKVFYAKSRPMSDMSWVLA